MKAAQLAPYITLKPPPHPQKTTSVVSSASLVSIQFTAQRLLTYMFYIFVYDLLLLMLDFNQEPLQTRSRLQSLTEATIRLVLMYY